ncbi:MAG: NifU family protein [Cytophagales bacterium]|nr:NifU family protein [Cytophagales bacterium]
MEQENQRAIVVYAEGSPNPNTVKYVLNFPLVENMQVEYASIEEAKNCPLAVGLFKEFPFVQSVFIASNFISLTKDEKTEWFEHNGPIRAFIRNHFQDEKPLFLEAIQQEIEEKEKEEEVKHDSEIDAKIKAILNDYVRPAVESDGGNISYDSFNNGVVKVILQGACSGCPSSTQTLKHGIENLLKRMLPEVEEVVAVNG